MVDHRIVPMRRLAGLRVVTGMPRMPRVARVLAWRSGVVDSVRRSGRFGFGR
ncbi:MAG: hypothetical protein RL375_1602, partial [Pseudomonadota bacterium]